MIEKLRQLRDEYGQLQQKMQSADVYNDPKEMKRIGKRIRDLEPLIPLLEEYDRLEQAKRDVSEVGNDPELVAMAEEEAQKAEERMPVLMEEMKSFLVPKDPDDDKGVILEVRAGAGGDEAALFAAEQLRMYLRYAEEQGWTTELLRKSDAGVGGIKEAIVRIDGVGAYGALKFESGVHRVQRIPETESKGRVHTSTTTVAIMPEVEEVDFDIKPDDLRIDVFRASGAGGQHVNKTESAVRITHLPTGVTSESQSERSQQRNKEHAMRMLRSRLYQAEQERLAKERGDLRSSQVGTGDRSEKIRTYNFPQDRITDHRAGLNFSNIPVVMEGKIDDIVEALQNWEKEQLLSAL